MVSQLSIDNTFKNIHSVTIDSIILAKGDNADYNSRSKEDAATTGTIYTSKDVFQFPYLLLNIEEFSQNLFTTNKLTATSAFLTPNDEPNTSSARSYGSIYAYYGRTKVFYPNIIGSLHSLNVNIMYSNGETYAYNNPVNIDNHNITNLEYIPSTAIAAATIRMTIDPPFLKDLYRINDILLIKNCRIQNSTSDNSHVQSIESFLNRMVGHSIGETPTLITSSTGLEIDNFANTIIIDSDIRVNQNGLGLYDYFETIGSSVINDTESTFIGEMLNYCVQPTFNFTINTLTRDDNGEIEIDYEL